MDARRHLKYTPFFIILALVGSVIVCCLLLDTPLTEMFQISSPQPKNFLIQGNRTHVATILWPAKKSAANRARIAYALLCTESHWRYVYVLAHRIRMITRINYDLLILTPERLPQYLVDLFGPKGLDAIIIQVTLEPPPTVKPLEAAFKVAWIKLHLFTLTSYDRILYLDSDVLLLKDISPIFHIDAFASVSLACDSRLDLAGLNGGILLLKPNATQYSELLALAATPSPTDWKYSEQQLLSVYFVWMHPELFVPLSTHFMIPYQGLDDHGLLAMHSNGRHWLFRDRSGHDVLTRIYTVHFVCGRKPWERSPYCADLFGKESAKCAAVRMWYEHAQDSGLW